MKNKSILLVYYSQTGNTKIVAERLAEHLSCDIEEIQRKDTPTGIFGYLRNLFEVLSESAPQIESLKYHPENYQLVLLGTPVWMNRMASPMRTYLLKFGDNIQEAAFFLTNHRTGKESVFNEMQNHLHKHPIAKLALHASEIQAGGHVLKIRTFGKRLLDALEKPLSVKTSKSKSGELDSNHSATGNRHTATDVGP